MTLHLALPTTAPSGLKRHAPAEFDDVDSENIDPFMFSSPAKKGRSFDFDLTKSQKAPLFAFTPPKPAQYIQRAQVAGQKRKADDTVTPAAGVKRRAEPSSAPAPAGRSPKHKRIGILSRRRMTTSSFTRVDPPSSSADESANGLPFSIDAALAGTVPKYKLKSGRGKGWHFDIHEETEVDQDTNVMQFRTGSLKVSGDESDSWKGDTDNKENIPPVEGPAVGPAAMAAATKIAATRRDMMTDEIRQPLGDLNAKDFYAEGCDASSCVIIAAEDSTEPVVDKLASTISTQEPSTSPCPSVNALTDTEATWEEITRSAIETAIVANTNSATEKENPKEATDFQIWESESAKGDDDADAPPNDGANEAASA